MTVSRHLRGLPHRLVTGLAGALVVALAATGCGLSSGGAVPVAVGPGSIRPVPALEGVKVTVGGKEFTEQLVMAYLVELVLSAAGMQVNDLSGLAGSNSFRQALLNGEIDMGMEYTGTAWVSYMGEEKPIPDEREQWQAVHDKDLAEHHVVWFPPTTVNNTYSFAVDAENARRTGVRTMSDLADLIRRDPGSATLCVETEFQVRRDGLPGMGGHYGFPVDRAKVSTLQTGIIYQATAEGRECTFGEVFTTDGRIKGLGLQVLQDDKKFFPNYNAAISARQDFVDAHPEVQQVLEPLRAVLTNEVMMDLNARVDVDGEDPAAVARDFLVSRGLVTARQ